MEKLTCPHCNEVSYSASSRAFSPCPHCKFRFAITEDEDGRKCIVIEKEVADLREDYAKKLAGSSAEIEVIIDRREQGKPFDGTDRRRVATAP